MSRNFNRDFPSTVQQHRETGDCKTVHVSSSTYPRDGGQEYRSAPNGVFPFFQPTAMAASREIRGGGEFFHEWQGTSQYIDDRWGKPMNPVPNDFSSRRAEARNIARYEAYQKVYDKLTSMDLSETLVQAKQTAKMVGLAQTVADLTKTAVGRFGITKAISAGYMWTQFGVKPLVNDMFGLLELTSRQVKKPFTVSAGNTQRFKITPVTNPYGHQPEAQITYRVSATFETGAFDSLSNITSMDPAYIAWTAIPFTFISDYFYNIGGYLRQMELAALYNTAFTHGCESARVHSRGMLTSAFNRTTGWQCKTPYLQIHTSEVNYDFYERGVLAGFPTPMPPQFKLDLGSSQMTNIAAVIAQGLGGNPCKYTRCKNFK